MNQQKQMYEKDEIYKIKSKKFKIKIDKSGFFACQLQDKV